MPHCTICDTECSDPTRHLDTANHHPYADVGTPSNESVPDDSDSTFCFQCSRDFATPVALSAHLRDARVHNRTSWSMYESRYSGEAYALSPSRSPSPRAQQEQAALGYTGSPMSNSAHSSDSISSQGEHDVHEELEGPTHLYDANHGPSHAFSLEETASDDDGDVSMDASSHDQSHDNSHDRNFNNHSYNAGISSTTHAERQHNYTHTTGVGPPSDPYTHGGHLHVQPISSGPGRSRMYASTRTTQAPASHHKNDSVPGMQTGTSASHSENSSPLRRASASNPRPRPQGLVCPICLELADGPTSTLCGHIFCASCIKEALRIREACPVCNRAVGQWTPHPIYPVF